MPRCDTLIRLIEKENEEAGGGPPKGGPGTGVPKAGPGGKPKEVAAGEGGAGPSAPPAAGPGPGPGPVGKESGRKRKPTAAALAAAAQEGDVDEAPADKKLKVEA